MRVFVARLLFWIFVFFVFSKSINLAYLKVLNYLLQSLGVPFNLEGAKSHFDLYLFYSLPAAAVILASRSGSFWRKLAFSLLTVLTSLFFSVVYFYPDIYRLVESSIDISLTPLSFLVSTMFNSAVRIFPFIWIIIFARANLSCLWKRKIYDPENPNRCPYCGKIKSGIREHIKTAHGRKKLKEWEEALKAEKNR